MKTRFIFIALTTIFLGLSVSCTSKKEVPVEISLSTSQLAYTVDGGEASVQLKSNAGWSAASSASWLTVTPSEGAADASLSLKAEANVAPAGQASSSRSATVTVTAGEKAVKINATQVGETVVFTVVPGPVQVPCTGGTVNVKVEHNTDYQVDIQAGVTWVTRLETKSTITDNVSFAVEANSGAARSAKIFFKANGAENTVTVNQDEKPYEPSFSGAGTESDPYVISTATQLVEFSTVTNSPDYYSQFKDKSFSLGADIDMKDSGQYVPACSDEQKPFKGVFDGNGHKISNLKFTGLNMKASGLVAYTDGATIRNVSLAQADIDACYIYCGAIVGIAKSGTTIRNVSVSGKIRQYNMGITADGIANSGLSGGLVGVLDNSSLEGGVVDADVTFYGKFSGGVVGYALNSTVSDCHFLKDHSLNIYYHFSGGIVGRARGEKNLISSCSFEGGYTTVGYVMGGIVGQLFGGKVEKCVLGSYAIMGSDKYFVGGIAGTAQPESEIVIEQCACYGNVSGAYSVAGIVGYSGSGAGASDIPLSSAVKPVTIRGCALSGGQIMATGGNSSGYPIAGGILGWSHGSNHLSIVSCFSRPGLIQTTFGDNANGVLSGISAYQNSTGGAEITDCYTSFTSSDLLVCNDPASDVPSNWYAGIAIRCTQATDVSYNYSHSSLRCVYTSSAATVTGNEELEDGKMTDGTLLAKLQQHAPAGISWVAGADGYPTVSGLPADPNVKKRAAKRVSVIGDSISTFKGWIPGGYAAHYPATDGTLTLVNETYWYRLIYDYMKDAELSMNIAFSGSTVTNTTAENYAAKYGTTSNSWWHNSFVERFAKCGGCGRPDIILIHGGTNDWAHNADPLAPGVAIRNDGSNIYGGSKPSDVIMAEMYKVADAAKTRDAVNGLPDGTFCEAYIKLMCQIRERYPRCKVVCIIGDYLSQSVEQSVIDIAGHYGAKTVNLFRVNGFNDLGGYSPSTLANKGSQPNMPKHDYSGDLSGCHPGSKAMEFIANKIYIPSWGPGWKNRGAAWAPATVRGS